MKYIPRQITALGQQKLRNKSVLKLLPFIVLFLLFGCGKVRVENYYIPYGFEGNVAIIYNNAGKSNTDANVFNYHIPPSGILYSETPFVEGDFISNYYQKRKSGGFDTLFVKWPSDKFDSSKNFIGFPRILSFSKGESVPIDVTSFYIGRKQDFLKERIDFERRLEKILLNPQP